MLSWDRTVMQFIYESVRGVCLAWIKELPLTILMQIGSEGKDLLTKKKNY